MAATEPIIEALTLAGSHLSEPEVRAAYEQLVRMLESHIVEQPFLENEAQPLTETQLVLLRHGLRRLGSEPRSSDVWVEMQQAADTLSEAVSQTTTITIGQQVIQKIDRVQGGNVVMTGITNHYGAAAAPAEPPYLPEAAPEEVPLAPSKRTHDIFLSYSRKDARTMRRLHADLTAAGFTLWTDENLTPGTPSWMTAIETAIQSAGCMVVLLTPDAKKSPWVERELTRASAYGLSVFPLLARGDERNAVPLILSSHQWADIRKERDYRMSVRKLIRAVRGQLAKLNDLDD